MYGYCYKSLPSRPEYGIIPALFLISQENPSYRYSGRTKSASVFGSPSKLCAPS